MLFSVYYEKRFLSQLGDTVLDILDAIEKWGSERAAAKALGIPRSTFQDRAKKAKETVRNITAERRAAVRGVVGGPPIPEIAIPPEGFVIRRNSSQFNGEGELERQWIESGQGNTDGYEVPEGHSVKGESTLVDSNGNVIVKWVKTNKDAVSHASLVDGLKEAFASYDGASPCIPVPVMQDADLLTLYPLPDLHLGMQSWGKETGEDYDLKIATDLAINSLETLVAQSRPSKHAVLLGLGDYFHADDQKNVTPGSGHQLDVDGRHAKVFAAGAKLATTMVDILARKHHDVEVRFLSGNHDINSAMCLTVALSLFYSNNSRISVNSSPGIAWYRRFGKCLLGAAHGHTVKMDAMPMMMAADRAADWGVTEFKSFFSGHIHHQAAKEIAGVLVESLQSPAARDAWNAANGYRSGRSLAAITFHNELGEIGRHRVNIRGGLA